MKIVATFVCPICEEVVSAGEQHKCKPKPIPFNVLNDKIVPSSPPGLGKGYKRNDEKHWS